MTWWHDNTSPEVETPRGMLDAEGIEFWMEVARLSAYLTEHKRHIVDFGCGARARLAKRFDADLYTGVDIEARVEQARKNVPSRTFETRDAQVECDALIAHTVFLHLKPSIIIDVVEQYKPSAIFISEVMDRRARNETGDPPAYNRWPDEYCDILGDFGYHPVALKRMPYKAYPDKHQLWWLQLVRFEEA